MAVDSVGDSRTLVLPVYLPPINITPAGDIQLECSFLVCKRLWDVAHSPCSEKEIQVVLVLAPPIPPHVRDPSCV